MIRYMYYDYFTNEYCRPSKQELGIAPPERYLKTVPNSGGDYYVEHWKVSGSSLGDRLDVCYRDPEYANIIRHELEERNDCTLQYIIWWEIPVSKFNGYAKRFGLVKESKRRKKMTEKKKKQLEAYVLAASVNAPAKTKAWLDYLETLSDEEKEKEIDRAIFDRGFKRFETEVKMSDGIGHIRTSRPLKEAIKASEEKTRRLIGEARC